MVLLGDVFESNGVKKYDGIRDDITARIKPCPCCGSSVFCVRQYDSMFAFECHNDECCFGQTEWFDISCVEEELSKFNKQPVMAILQEQLRVAMEALDACQFWMNTLPSEKELMDRLGWSQTHCENFVKAHEMADAAIERIKGN